jgi:alpha-galactosidase
MWVMMAAPLIAGTDLRSMSTTAQSILTNPDAIKINQDQLGAQGVLARDDGDLELWSKKLTPSGTRAVALLNRSNSNATMQVSWGEIGLANGITEVYDVWRNLGLSISSGNYSTTVPAHGVALLKVTGAEGSAPTPNVLVANTDPRTITDLRVTVDFQIDGSAHHDFEDVGTFDKTLNLDLNGWGGTWDGSRYTGDLLYAQKSATGSKLLNIHKVDGRTVTNLRVSVDFKINGAPHYDYEDVAALTGSINLVLNGNGGRWDGSKWVGDFLHH